MEDLTNATVAILAGGLGTRLRSVVADRPKVLVEVGSYPFLAYLLNQLQTFGFRNVVICTGYLGDQIQKKFGKKYKNLLISYSQELSPLGTAGAIRLALPLLKSDTVMIMNGDSFCDANLRKFWRFHSSKGADATLLLTKVSDTSRFGRVNIGRAGRIVSFEEKGKEGAGWINGGIYLISKSLLLKIPEKEAVSFEQEMFPTWINRDFYGYRSRGRFIDIGTAESYNLAKQFFSAKL